MNPNGKVVIITGASAGIGAAAARAFAGAGARVVLAARNAAQLEAVARGLAGPALVVPTDVADRAAVDALVARAVEAYGGIDIVVNNAGVGLAAPVAQIAFEDFQRALAVDLFGPLALTQAALPYLRQRGRGQLIYISSVVGLRALPYLGGYAAAKAALDRLVESLRMELRGSGVAVTLVRPGTTSTGFAQSRLGAGQERRRGAHARSHARAGGAGDPGRGAARARVAYVSLADRLRVLFGLLAPGIADAMLARAFEWEET